MTNNVENRLTQAVSNLNGAENYGYDAAGLRLWKQGPDGVTHVFYNGLGGKPLADCYLASGSVQGGTPMVYFAGKRVDNQSVEDRLGTARVEGGTASVAHYPYGELSSPTSAELQFATYKHDSTTSFDYAQHRYYSSQIARFLTVDHAPASPTEPQSWNRYSYVGGDPVNRNDAAGLFWANVDEGSGSFGFQAPGFQDDPDNPRAEVCIDTSYSYETSGGMVSVPDTSCMNASVTHRMPLPVLFWKARPQQANANMWKGIEKALKVLQENANCRSLFSGPDLAGKATPDPVTFLYEIAAGEDVRAYFEVGDIPQTKPGTITSAITGPTGDNVNIDIGNGDTQLFPVLQITINDLAGVFLGSDLNQQAATILHELGHVYADLFGPQASQITSDQGNTKASEANQDKVNKACGL